MADLVTRILLNDKQFNDTLTKSKQQVSNFNQIGSVASGMVTKFAGALGLAAGAGATLNKTIQSVQSTGDAFNNSIGAAKGTVDQFFKSLATGDFSAFTNGLDAIYKKAFAAQAALDQLWNTQNSYSRAAKMAQASITEARADAYDPELSKEERYKAVGAWRSAVTELEEYANTYRKDVLDATQKIAASYNLLNPGDITMEMLDRFVLLDAKGSVREDVKKKLGAEYDAYQQELKQIAAKNTTTITQGTNYGAVSQSILSDEGRKLQEEAAKRYKDAIVMNTLLERMTDEQLQDIRTKLDTYDQVGTELNARKLELNRSLPRLQSRIEKESGGSGGSPKVKVNIIPAGSLAELEKQIADARKSFLNATTDEARAAADLLIKDLESRKAILEIQFKYKDLKNIEAGSTLTSADPLSPLKSVKHTDMSGSFQVPEEGRSYSAYLSEIADKNRDLIDTVYGVSDVLYGLGDVLGESAGKWLQWGANVVSTVGRSLPALLGLANANAAVAASGGAASVAGIPIVGPVLAAGAVLSIMGALMNLPKFEHSGVVGGNSYTGDKLLARVNSGELILNAKHQALLLDQLESSGVQGRVRFEIEGSRLAGILEQERKRNSRL